MSIACWWSVSLFSRSSYFSDTSASAATSWWSRCCSTNSSQISPRFSRGTPVHARQVSTQQTLDKHRTFRLGSYRQSHSVVWQPSVYLSCSNKSETTKAVKHSQTRTWTGPSVHTDLLFSVVFLLIFWYNNILLLLILRCLNILILRGL